MLDDSFSEDPDIILYSVLQVRKIQEGADRCSEYHVFILL